MKSFAESKTIWSSLIIALLVKFWPAAGEWVSNNPEVFALGWAALSIFLRFLTKTPINISGLKSSALLCVLTMVGCSSVDQILTPGVFYRRDLKLSIDGQDYDGVGVLSERPRYEIVLTPRQDIDALLIKTCHRTLVFEKISGGGWFGAGKFRYTYEPIPNLESGRVCPLRVEAFNAAKSKHAWSYLDTASSRYEVTGTSVCNGASQRFTGVALCQAGKGLVQKISFDKPVRFAPVYPPNCETPRRVKDGYEYSPIAGECIYHFETQDRKIGRLTVLGFEQIKLSETQ